MVKNRARQRGKDCVETGARASCRISGENRRNLHKEPLAPKRAAPAEENGAALGTAIAWWRIRERLTNPKRAMEISNDKEDPSLCACRHCQCEVTGEHTVVKHGQVYCCQACAEGHAGGEACQAPRCHCAEAVAAV